MSSWQRVACVLSAWLTVAVLHPLRAAAEPEAFVRLDQSTWLRKHELGISYGLEVKTAIRDYEKSGGGGGGGGGLGGRRSYQGVTHRLWTGFGFARWLSGSVEQTMGQTEADVADFEYKVLTLQLRSHWRKIFPRLPVDLDSFVESRIRVNARRKPSMVMGMGVGRTWGKLRLVGNAGFETTVDEDRRENGARYEIAFSYRPWRFFMMGCEAWGSLVWPDYSVFQQDHHGGPSLMFSFKGVWLGANAAVGIKERPNRIFLDVVTMAKLGVQF